MASTSSMNQFPFTIITGRTVQNIIHNDLAGCMEAVREGYLAHGDGRSVNPASVFLKFPDRPNARIIGLPTHLAAPWGISGIKWIASYPDNVTHGFPRASAVLILNSHEHGYPFACMEASIISASRTAASAVLAACHLSSKGQRAASLGIVGCGLIARYVYQFLTGTGWEIDKVSLYDTRQSEAERFRVHICDSARHSEVQVASDLATLLTTSDLILFTTIAGKPHVHNPDMFAHKPLVLHVSLRDLAPELLLDACNVVDDVDHVMHADTSPHLAEQLTGGRSFVTGTLADIMTGRKQPDHSRTVIFSPFGLGVLDLAVGKWVYERAVAAEQYLPVNDFFYDLQR